MGNKYDQSKEAAAKFHSRVLDYILTDPNRTFEKEEFCHMLCMSEREVRRELERIANYYPVVATSDRKGYRIPFIYEGITVETLKENIELYDHQLAELRNRVASLEARMKPLIAFKAVCEKLVAEDEVNIDESIDSDL